MVLGVLIMMYNAWCKSQQEVKNRQSWYFCIVTLVPGHPDAVYIHHNLVYMQLIAPNVESVSFMLTC